MSSSFFRLVTLRHLRIFLTTGLLVSLLAVVNLTPANANVAITSITSSNWQANTGQTFATTTLNNNRTGWTVSVSQSQDDSNFLLPLPAGFTTTFNGIAYNRIFPGSNTYITFGSGSSQYSSLSASNPPFPGVHMCSRDNSWQLVMYKWENSNQNVRIRYEGTNRTSGTIGSPNIIYEAVFYNGAAYFDLAVGGNSACPASSRATSGSVQIASFPSTNLANSFFRIGASTQTAPTFQSAAVTSDGTQIILTYNNTLSATTASTSAFAVTVAGASANVSTVAISGSTVVLTMATRITTGQAVTFTYTDPSASNDANAVQDVAGNDAATLGSTSVTNSSTITRPVFSAPTTGLTATAQTAYTLTLTAATGGSGSGYTYTLATGTLPDGLTLNGRIISGTPTTSGTFPGISITVTDGNSVTTTTATFSITVNRGSQTAISIATRYGSGGFPLILAIQGGSGTGALTYTLDPLVQSSCVLTGSTLTPNFGIGTSGTCYVKAVRAQDQAFSESSSATTAIFFTAYVPVVEQTMTCPPGTTPSVPTGIGVGSCIQVLAPVSPTAGDSGAAPKITSLSATSGLVGATITITGTGLSTVTRVQFGTKSTTEFTKTATTITVNVPVGATRGRVMAVSPTGTALAPEIFTVTVE